jgi:hypothetical protein
MSGILLPGMFWKITLSVIFIFMDHGPSGEFDSCLTNQEIAKCTRSALSGTIPSQTNPFHIVIPYPFAPISSKYSTFPTKILCEFITLSTSSHIVLRVDCPDHRVVRYSGMAHHIDWSIVRRSFEGLYCRRNVGSLRSKRLSINQDSNLQHHRWDHRTLTVFAENRNSTPRQTSSAAHPAP